MLLTVKRSAPLPAGVQSGRLTIKYPETYVDMAGNAALAYYAATLNLGTGKWIDDLTGLELKIVGAGEGDPLPPVIDVVEQFTFAVTTKPTDVNTQRRRAQHTAVGELDYTLPNLELPTVGGPIPTIEALKETAEEVIARTNEAEELARSNALTAKAQGDRAGAAADSAEAAAALAQQATRLAGRGIVSSSIVNGRMILSYTDGTSVDVGEVVGQDGQPGVGFFEDDEDGFPRWVGLPDQVETFNAKLAEVNSVIADSAQQVADAIAALSGIAVVDVQPTTLDLYITTPVTATPGTTSMTINGTTYTLDTLDLTGGGL